MKHLLLYFLLLCGTAQALSNDWKNIRTTVTLSYESRYVLYGYDSGPDLYHADLAFWLPVSDKLSAWAGSWYGTQPSGTYNEIDLYAGFDYQFNDHVSAGLAYSLFNYLEMPYPSVDRSHEFSGHLTYTAGPISLSLRDLYDTDGEGHLARAIASFDQPLTDALRLGLSAEYGYSLDYFAVGNGPNHTLFKLELPWQINETFSLKPFLAHSIALDVIDSFEKDRTYGGISLAAAF
jgi:hypothetical protein